MAFLALAHRVACLFGLACVPRAGQPTEGRQPAEGSPQGDAKHRQHAAGIAAVLTPWPSQKSSSNAALCNFFTGSEGLLSSPGGLSIPVDRTNRRNPWTMDLQIDKDT